MKKNNSWYKHFALLIIVFISSTLAVSCGREDGGSTAGPESLRIYEITVGQGNFIPAGDDTHIVLRLDLNTLSNLIFFTNRGALDAGYNTIPNLIDNIWPRIYQTTAPNAVLQYKVAGTTYKLLCVLNNPVYDRATGLLDFTITYLEGSRPVENLALTDIKMIVTNNAAQVQPPEWSTILGGDEATFKPTGTPGVYTLTIDGVHPDVLDFTSAPHRNSLLITPKELVESWNTRFGSEPPNAAISYRLPSDSRGGVQVVVLTNPVYDESRNSLGFTAELLFDTAPIGNGLTMVNPSLFIDGGEGNTFPTCGANHFSIQYRNSTPETITIWLNGAQPPCSQAEASNCAAGNQPEQWADEWANMKDAFTRSGTHFYIHSKTTGQTTEIDVTNNVDLEPGETLRIVPPLDENNKPQWYYTTGGSVETAGVTGWVTRTGVDMPAPMQVNLLEYNLDYPNLEIWGDISGVDGINLNVSMALEGQGCGGDATCGTGVTMPRKVMTNIDAYDGTNDGCPYIITVSGADTCPNPKHYPATISAGTFPDWVVGTDAFTTDDVESGYPDIWANAGSPTGLEMCAAASGDPDYKKAYHIWWSTNTVGQGWLDYLQKNDKGRCDAYGWAYDEKKWKPGDDFDVNGNPPDNTAVNPLFNGPMKDNTYLNIDIFKVM